MSWSRLSINLLFINYPNFIQIMKTLLIFEKLIFHPSSSFTLVFKELISSSILSFFLFHSSGLWEKNVLFLFFFISFFATSNQCMGHSSSAYECNLLKLLILTENQISVFEKLDEFRQCINIQLLFDYFLHPLLDCIGN